MKVRSYGEEPYLDKVAPAASRVPDMEGLAEVLNEVHEEPQRVPLLQSRGPRIRQDRLRGPAVEPETVLPACRHQQGIQDGVRRKAARLSMSEAWVTPFKGGSCLFWKLCCSSVSAVTRPMPRGSADNLSLECPVDGQAQKPFQRLSTNCLTSWVGGSLVWLLR